MEAARLLARGELDQTPPNTNAAHDEADHLHAAAAALGVVVEGAPGDAAHLLPFYLWPENLPAWLFFRHCGTQWRHGFNGPTGLDYAGIEVLMQRLHVPPRRRGKLWRGVWAMEQGALAGWAELAAERRQD